MFRSLLIAASLLGVATPAFAEGHVSKTPGAMAGRSPHALYVAADTGQNACGKAMHSLPAGKPHSYGRHALGVQPCDRQLLVDAAPKSAAGDN